MKKKFVVTLVYVITIILLLWILMSFIEINMHNKSDYIYSSWNLFIIIFNNHRSVKGA